MVVLHDLRIEINGRSAQIDHLLINRFCEVYVLETKTFSTGLSINERGEFSVTYDGRDVGIASPIEQNARHTAVLRDAFKSIGLPTRFGVAIKPSFHPVILVSQKAVHSAMSQPERLATRLVASVRYMAGPGFNDRGARHLEWMHAVAFNLCATK